MDDLTKGEHVDGKEKGTKLRALRHALVDWGWGVQPGESCTGEA